LVTVNYKFSFILARLERRALRWLEAEIDAGVVVVLVRRNFRRIFERLPLVVQANKNNRVLLRFAALGNDIDRAVRAKCGCAIDGTTIPIHRCGCK
jgi:hypothetical protein